MPKHLVFLFFVCLGLPGWTQIIDNQYNNTLENRYVDQYGDTIPTYDKEVEVELSGKTYYKDYKIIDHKLDTTYVDTTLYIGKSYKFNLQRKDLLEYMPFHNPGQSLNHLAYSFDGQRYLPVIGARAQHHNFYEVEDVKYYHVPTPTTELMWRTVLEQGHLLDALFTFNLSERFNASVAFKSIRSLGKYRHSRTDHGNARFTASYQSKNGRYFVRGHLVAQDLNNQQNGGLTEESIINFESGDANFTDRARLETNFTDAQNILRGNRYYVDHFYKLWDKKDSLRDIPSDLRIGHVFNYERKHFEYEQDNASALFGEAFVNRIDDDLKYSKMHNQAYLALNSPITLGEVRFKAGYFDFDYRYKSILLSDSGIISNKMTGNSASIGGEWHTRLKKFNLDVDANTLIGGDLSGHSYAATASFKKDSVLLISARAFNNSRSPNLNFMLNQSAYKSYNWQHNFKNEVYNGLEFVFDSKKWFYLSAAMTNIENFTYFADADQTGQTLPEQYDQSLAYFKAKLSKEFRFGKFALDNQFIYQKVTSGEEVLRVPDFITRNTFYYANYLFKGKPMYLETGVTLTYFSAYLMNAYNPVIGEFYLQNDREFGGFPMLDFFVNFKVRTMRVYFTLEHFNSPFTENNYYSAPGYPYRDFVVRLGLVWNFFI